MTEERNEALGWDDQIANDDAGLRQLIPEGVYPFEIVDLQRAQHKQTGVIPDCPKAILKVRVFYEETSYVDLMHNLYLHTTREGLLCSFFKGIGQRKHGEKLKPDWNRVVGAKGRCKVVINEWRPDGEIRKRNEIKAFLDPSKPVPNAIPPRFKTKGSDYVCKQSQNDRCC